MAEERSRLERAPELAPKAGEGASTTAESGRESVADFIDRTAEQIEGGADGTESMPASGAGMAAVGQARELAPKAREAAYTAAESGREGVADFIERTAERIEGGVGGTESMPAKAVGRAAQTMHGAADYLEGHETAEIVDDVERYIRTHPVRSMTAAVATGFIVGRILR